jgi:hypothetical protein
MKYTRLTRVHHYYPGPTLESLDPSLKTAIIDYMEELGVNNELAEFIDLMALDKDQILYTKWLESTKKFLEK